MALGGAAPNEWMRLRVCVTRVVCVLVALCASSRALADEPATPEVVPQVAETQPVETQSNDAPAGDPEIPPTNSDEPPAQPADTEERESDERDSGEFETPSRIKPGWFHLNFNAAYLEFESDTQWRTVNSSRLGSSVSGLPLFNRAFSNTKQRNRDLRFTERFGLSMTGDIIDPNLIDWSADFSIGLRQGSFREELYGFENDDTDSGILTEFDISMDVLKSKPVSMNAYVRRSNDRIVRRFLSSLRERRTESGVSVLALTGPVTTEVGFAFSDVERTGNQRLEDDEELTTRRFYTDTTWNIADGHRLRLRYEHEDQQNTYQGSNYNFDVIRDEFRLEHELAFGPDKKHVWDTFLRLNTEAGSLARDEFEAFTRLTLKHNDKFRTTYRYGFYRYDQYALRVDLNKFDFEAMYQPTKDLRITLDGFYLNEAVDADVETDQYGAAFDVAYRKPNDYGELTVNLNVGYDQSRSSSGSGRRIVRDEAHALDDVRPVVLRQGPVDLGSVIVHDLTRTRLYILGRDYNLVLLGGRVLIRRIQDGRINQGDIVYVDYSYRISTSAKIDTYRADLLIEHPFNSGWTPYYYFESRTQDANGNDDIPLLRDNMHRHRIGVRYEKDRWGMGTELEIFDDTIEPYDSMHLTGRWNALRSAEHTLDLTGELSYYRFEGGVDKRQVWWLDLGVTDRWQLNPYTSLNTTAVYHREDDSVDGITDGVDLEMALAYTRNYLSLELVVEYDLLEIDRNMDEGLGVFVRVRRDLGHLFSNRRGVR